MTVFVILVAGAALTWLLRVSLITVVPSSKLPVGLQRAIEGIGPAALAALVATELSHHVAATGPLGAGEALGAAAIAGVVAWTTKRMNLTVIVGVSAFWILSTLVG